MVDEIHGERCYNDDREENDFATPRRHARPSPQQRGADQCQSEGRRKEVRFKGSQGITYGQSVERLRHAAEDRFHAGEPLPWGGRKSKPSFQVNKRIS